MAGLAVSARSRLADVRKRNIAYLLVARVGSFRG
jgi:hypothetical protein